MLIGKGALALPIIWKEQLILGTINIIHKNSSRILISYRSTDYVLLIQTVSEFGVNFE